MQITIESIQEVEDPYHAFVDSVKSKETLRKYIIHLDRFLKLVPTSVYLEHLGESPSNDSKPLSKVNCMPTILMMNNTRDGKLMTIIY
jgi:hypothetical protein